VTSAFAFSLGAAIPLLSGAFLPDPRVRMLSVAAASTFGLALFGAVGASLGGARVLVGALRVLIGGCLAMALTYAVGTLFGAPPA
jgi:VIT1/CCC1 family predicted Fe2+/Mn2+ transporter